MIAIAGAFVGIPAVALAASFIFATVTGETSFSDSKAGLTIVSASGTVSNALNCEKTEGKGDTFTINPIASRVTVGDQTSVVPGTCTVTIQLHNNGNTAVAAPDANINFPRGWKLSVGPDKPVPADSDGALTLTISTTRNAEQGKITGNLSSDTDAGA